MLSKSSFEFSCIVARLLGMIKCKIAIEQSKEIFPPVSFHHLWNFLLAKNKLPPPSSLSPSLSMVYWSICILGGSIVLVRKSIVLVERDCANAIVQYSIIVKLSIIVSDHCNCQIRVLWQYRLQTVQYCKCHCKVQEYWTIALVCRQRMQPTDNLTWRVGP